MQSGKMSVALYGSCWRQTVILIMYSRRNTGPTFVVHSSISILNRFSLNGSDCSLVFTVCVKSLVHTIHQGLCIFLHIALHRVYTDGVFIISEFMLCWFEMISYDVAFAVALLLLYKICAQKRYGVTPPLIQKAS